MNGLGLPGPEPTVRELRDQLALALACEPIQQENADAKQAYRAARAAGDPAAIAAAKQRKQDAANRINETRTWLRGEARIAYLKSMLAHHGSVEAALQAQMERELEGLEQLVAPFREAFGSLPAPTPVVAVEDGSVSVSTPAVRVKAKGN